jgi:hypothetical protein
MTVFNNALAGAAGSGGGDDGYKIQKSLRFNEEDSAYLYRTFSGSDRKTFSLSFWYKPAVQGSSNRRHIFSARSTGGHVSIINFRDSDDALELYHYNGSSLTFQVVTKHSFRDTSAWYGFLVVYDSTAAVASERIKLYCNGSRITEFQIANYPSQNYGNVMWNDNGQTHRIGQDNNQYLSGYLAEMRFLDSIVADPSWFGKYNADGVWVPIEFVARDQTVTSSTITNVSGNTLTLTDNTNLDKIRVGDVVGDTRWWQEADYSNNVSGAQISPASTVNNLTDTNSSTGLQSKSWGQLTYTFTGVTKVRFRFYYQRDEIWTLSGGGLQTKTLGHNHYSSNGWRWEEMTVTNSTVTSFRVAASKPPGYSGDSYIEFGGIEVNDRLVVDNHHTGSPGQQIVVTDVDESNNQITVNANEIYTGSDNTGVSGGQTTVSFIVDDYGFNGFELKFLGTTDSTIGNDTSGNGRHWTNKNLVASHTPTATTSHRYWRVQTYGTGGSHVPRLSKIYLYESNGTRRTHKNLHSDNCSDQGPIPAEGTNYDADYTNQYNFTNAGLYATWNGCCRSAVFHVYYSDDNTNWTYSFSTDISQSGCGEKTGTVRGPDVVDLLVDVPTDSEPETGKCSWQLLCH